jgi:subtilisin family serine protease
MAAAPAEDALTAGDEGVGPYAEGQVIVQFEPGTAPFERREAREGAGVGFAKSLSLSRTQLVAVDGPVRAAVRRLERQPGVAYAQPNYRYEALAVEPPDDTFFEQLWGLSDPALPDPGVSALEAWEESKGGGQVIAVVDTGVDLTHPDLEPNLWTNTLEGPGLPGDQDLNGFVDDVHGYDFVDDDGDPDDYEFHGTHVAGTAAAVAGNNKGIAGVAPEAEIMAVRVLDGNGSGFTAEIAEGIAYAAENGADVINLSLGGPAGGDQATEDAIEIAAAEDAVVVAAAGNEGVSNDVEPHTPCALPQANLICVAALNQAGSLAGFSNFGPKSVDIAAPGTGTLSAKVDYGAPLFSNGFEPGTTELWSTFASNGGINWGISSQAASGAQSATDSPAGDYGQAVDPSEFAASELFTDDPVDLTDERGCRVHFRAMYEIEEFFDLFFAGAGSEESDFDGNVFDGTSSGYPSTFSREEASISDMDDHSDVHPIFAVLSDESIEFDGAYVDDVRLICRDEAYVDAIASGAEYDLPDAGNYVRFNGTSMATPHVAGVAALVRAAEPNATALETVEAILAGASAIPTPDPSRRTASEGIADACQAIAVATGSSDPLAECPGSSENVIPSPPAPVPQPQAQVLAGPPPTVSDQTMPRTFFRQRPPRVIRTRSRRAKVVFRFGSDEAGVTFVCRVDGAPYRSCPARLVRRFRLGPHILRVVARDAAGNVDRTPAVARFRVKRRS